MAPQMNDNQADVLEEALTRFVGVYFIGEQPDIDEFIGQYPQCKTQLKKRIKDLQEIDSLFDSLVHADESDFEDSVIKDDLVGRKISSFEITKVIGRGGMGVVYFAHDTKLKRSVAIKSMPAQLKDDSTAQTRFRREAELLASLNHPNIAAIHDIIEQDEGTSYLVLEYVPGETLTERIKREPLKLEEALSIAQQIAQAVSAAHKKGIIHRDLKPGNIKLTPEGRIKVLDFGLAKPSVSEGIDFEITSTEPGHIIGTPAYMSPEQARGNPTDHRTDIWSFGCIIYQMLTGQLPFKGETATDTLARIIERQPDWDLLPNETPENIRVLLRHCLEKNQDERLGNIADAAIELEKTLSGPAAPVRALWRWAMAIGFVVVAIVVGLNIGRWRESANGGLGGAGPDRIKSLAVLPLQNLTGDPEQEYFVDGMTEALIANLGKIGALQVRSRTSIMQYKDVKKPLPEIARELNVDAVVEGSVVRVAEQVCISAQLIHAPTDTHLWVESYERDLRDVLALQSEVARTIARQIEITVTPDQEERLAETRPVNPETYMAYLKGMFHLNKMTPEGTEKGLAYLHQAIEKDPADPLAYGGMALGYVESAHGPGAPPDALARAEAAALKALELDGTLTEAHAALAQINLYRDWDWEAAEHAFQRALELNPNLTLTRAQYSWYLLLLGRTDEALAEMRRVQELDPLTPLWPAWQGTQYLWTGQYEKAIDEARKSLELNPDFVVALSVLGSAYAEKGMYEESIKAHQRAAQISRYRKSGLGCTYAMAGRPEEARQVLAELEADPTPYDTWFIAQIYAVLGDKDEAFRWLEAAYGPPHHPYVPWIKHPPAFKPLQDDPRFGDLLRRINLPE
jgi:serine/threonine protein kinase/tetratricopeptide (TPR) repeat protein